eukprot:2207495-Lingulodinium_polyedra.AAC.1
MLRTPPMYISPACFSLLPGGRYRPRCQGVLGLALPARDWALAGGRRAGDRHKRRRPQSNCS